MKIVEGEASRGIIILLIFKDWVDRKEKADR